jgi:hypothetical protein
MMGVWVSQRQVPLYRCSSTAKDQFPLSAGRGFRGVLCVGMCFLCRADVMQRGGASVATAERV